MALEAYEILFPFNKHHSEVCPVCVTETSDVEDEQTMVRRSPDVYQCETCGLLILAGTDRFKMSKRVILGRAIHESVSSEFLEEIRLKMKEK